MIRLPTTAPLVYTRSVRDRNRNRLPLLMPCVTLEGFPSHLVTHGVRDLRRFSMHPHSCE